MRRNPVRPKQHARSNPFFLWPALILALAGGANAQSQSDEEENQIKAEFIERFAHYIEWPATAFTSKESPFVFCMEGEGPLRTLLEKILANSRIKDRSVILVAIADGEPATGCHILYIAPSEKDRIDDIIKNIGNAPVLTIGDSATFVERGVLITLFVEGSHVRFSINAASAKAKGLNMSAKLLVLARPASRR